MEDRFRKVQTVFSVTLEKSGFKIQNSLLLGDLKFVISCQRKYSVSFICEMFGDFSRVLHIGSSLRSKKKRTPYVETKSVTVLAVKPFVGFS